MFYNLRPYAYSKKLNNPKLVKQNKSLKDKAFAVFMASALVTAIGVAMPDDRTNEYKFESPIISSTYYDHTNENYKLNFKSHDYAIITKDYLDEEFKDTSAKNIQVNDEEISVKMNKSIGLKTALPTIGGLSILFTLLYRNGRMRENNQKVIDENKRKALRARIDEIKADANYYKNHKKSY